MHTVYSVCASVCVCLFQGVVPLTRCQQWLLLIVPGGSSISKPLIGNYKPHISHTQQSHTEFKTILPFMAIYFITVTM